MQLLRDTCARLTQAEVARRIKYKDSTVSQILSGTYGGSPDIVLQRVEEVFGSTTVLCPVLGEISLGKCADNRKRPLIATSPLNVQLWRACKECKS
jgi:transcriptional regulator with XRE-family HTH domain